MMSKGLVFYRTQCTHQCETVMQPKQNQNLQHININTRN